MESPPPNEPNEGNLLSVAVGNLTVPPLKDGLSAGMISGFSLTSPSPNPPIPVKNSGVDWLKLPKSFIDLFMQFRSV